LQEKLNNPKANGGKGYVSVDTIWVRDNSHKYRGMHIALKDGEWIATGKTIKEADLKAKEKGCGKSASSLYSCRRRRGLGHLVNVSGTFV